MKHHSTQCLKLRDWQKEVNNAYNPKKSSHKEEKSKKNL